VQPAITRVAPVIVKENQFGIDACYALVKLGFSFKIGSISREAGLKVNIFFAAGKPACANRKK